MGESANSSSAAEALIPQFKLDHVLNQDQAGRRITLLGSISSLPALLTFERAAFPTDPSTLRSFHADIANIKNLGDNDIYRWYLASSGPTTTNDAAADLKLNLIYPCTQQHIKKYSPQGVRMVTETPGIYQRYVRPYMQRNRDAGRLDWVFNILDGRTEQGDVILRDAGTGAEDGFLMLPDLNWDRKTVTSLHLLGLVERRDLWSLRDLKKGHVEWLRGMRKKMVDAVVGVYGGKGVEADMLKLYVHYQPTYYHFHIHIVHAQLEAGSTQATGKAFGLENIISQLQTMAGGTEAGMADVDLTYYIGEASELWTEIFEPLKRGAKG